MTIVPWIEKTLLTLIPDEFQKKKILKIQALFPQSPASAQAEAREDNTDIISVSPEEVLKAIKGAAEGLSPGPSGQRYEHLKQCISLPSKQLVQDLLASLATLFSAMANTELPNLLRPYLCSGSLIPANKKDGGIRPIVLGDVMASLCSKILLNQLISRFASLGSPNGYCRQRWQLSSGCACRSIVG